MKFYNRVNELAELERIRNLSFNDYSRMTVVTGRKRIGKTSLVMKFRIILFGFGSIILTATGR